ncbi:MAG: glycosyltransferase family 2 protein [Flavobacteriales bacterium]|nr:glycosyltransferase family 2 protein [Flavobacteriales bacterium]
MEKQLISIVMPVKNAGLYLEDCLKSIQDQTEEHWELLAVNDHSSDESYLILERFAATDSRIKVFNNKEKGIINALRTAYAESKGTFIHRMDADDLMVSTKLDILKGTLVESGIGHVATAKVQYFAKDGVNEGYMNYEAWLNSLCDQNNHWEELFKECVIASPNWMMHRSDFDTCGGFNSDTYPEDYDLVFRMYQAGIKVLAANKVTHLWRDHSERSSRNDANYAHNTFFEIKIHYFLALKQKSECPLVIWGAGKKGKRMAKLLKERNIPFNWVSNNPNKHGKEIYDQLMESFESIATRDNPQIVITVALRDAKQEIVAFLQKLNLKEGSDFYFFS